MKRLLFSIVALLALCQGVSAATLLKQSTATTVTFGPFVDATDGATAETTLTLSQADLKLSKNGAAFAQKGEATSAAHDTSGWYRVALNATDTGTLGALTLMCAETGALPVWREFQVVKANVWDSLIGGTDALDVEVASMASGVVTADAIATDAIGYAEFAAGAAERVASATWGMLVPGAGWGAGTAAYLLYTGLDTPVSSRAAAATALTTVTWTDARAAEIDNLDAAISSRSSHAPADNWTATTRTLTSGAGLTIGAVSGAVGSVTGAAGSVTGAVGSVTGAVGSVAGNVDGNVTGSVGSVVTSSDPTASEIQAELEENGASILDALQDRLTATRAGYLDNLDATISSRSSHSAADVWTATTRTLSASAGGDATAANQTLILDSLTAAKGATFATGTDSLEAIRNRGDAAWTGGTTLTTETIAAANWEYTTRTLTNAGSGPGAETFVYTLTSGGVPIADADVWVSTDTAGSHVIASGQTDQYGKITFYLDSGTVYVWRQKTGMNFTNPDVEAVP